MWKFGLACAAAAAALLLIPAGGGSKRDGGGESSVIVIRDTDTGYETADKFLRLYARNLAKLVPVFAQRVRETEDESYDIAKDWAAATEAARKEATAGVNARVAALAADEQMTRQKKAEWIEDAGRAWAAIGR